MEIFIFVSVMSNKFKLALKSIFSGRFDLRSALQPAAARMETIKTLCGTTEVDALIRSEAALGANEIQRSVPVEAPDFQSGGGGLPVHRQSDARFKWALAPGSWRATAKAQASAASCFARLESFAPPTKSRGLPPGRPEVDALTGSEVSARLKVASFSK